MLLMECLLLGLDLPASVGFIVWVLGFGPKSWGSVWLSVSEGFFIYLLWAGLFHIGPYLVVRTLRVRIPYGGGSHVLTFTLHAF